jgi:hypothetical protein
MHCVKHVTLFRHVGDWRQLRSCEQHELATQSPHVDPSEGHITLPHVPAVQDPEQHSPAVMQPTPSCLHCCPHVPLAQTPLQQSWKFMHGPPSGSQASWQVPPTQLPEQQLALAAHIWPF